MILEHMRLSGPDVVPSCLTTKKNAVSLVAGSRVRFPYRLTRGKVDESFSSFVSSQLFDYQANEYQKFSLISGSTFLAFNSQSIKAHLRQITVRHECL